MRGRLSLCALVILISGVSSGAGLAQSVARDPRAGVGVTFSDVGELVTIGSDDALAAQIVPGVLFPIQITSHFRVEPEVGGYRNASTLMQSVSAHTFLLIDAHPVHAPQCAREHPERAPRG